MLLDVLAARRSDRPATVEARLAKDVVVSEEDTSMSALGRGLTVERCEKRSVIALRVSSTRALLLPEA